VTTVLDRVPLDAITEQARQVRPGRALLTLVAGVLFGLGWVTSRVFAILWLACIWSWTAVRVGWEAEHGPSRGRRLAAQESELEDLRAQVKRLGG